MKRLFARSLGIFSLLLILLIVFTACGSDTSKNGGASTTTIHLGYFPNVTHAIALVGVARGTFKQALGSNTTLDIKTFNAGPALIEALFAGDIDIGYVGPNPAVNGYVKSSGVALRVIAGASSGGALFIVRPGANINSAKDLSGKKLATPQLGGTQDVALRHYLQQNGLNTVDKGGTVQIIPAQNPDILTRFKQGQIDGAWMPEPWASRLIQEDQGKVLVDERTLWPNNQFTTTVVVARKAFLDSHPDLVAKFLQAHVETVQYIKSNPASAETIINSELKRLSGKGLADSTLTQALKNTDITYDPLVRSFVQSADNAFALGFLGATRPNLDDIFDLAPLNKALVSKGLSPIAGL
jgi:sulfonate transport system substrate-binding protein